MRILPIVIAMLVAIQCFASCPGQSVDVITTCSCTNQRVDAQSCQGLFGGPCNIDLRGDICGQNGKITCYVPTTDVDHCFADDPSKTAQSPFLKLQDRIDVTAKMKFPGCDLGPVKFEQWLRDKKLISTLLPLQ